VKGINIYGEGRDGRNGRGAVGRSREELIGGCFFVFFEFFLQKIKEN